jgi:adhesin HecA-like repeat protein
MCGRRPTTRSERRPLRATFKLEQLDDRINPTAISWTGGGDGTSWSDSHNWSTGSVPGQTDDVTINSSATINLFGPETVDSLTLEGGTLNSSGTLSTTNGLTLSGGTLDNTGTVTINGAFLLSSGTLDGVGTTTLESTSTLRGGTITDQQVDNDGTATISGGTSTGMSGAAVLNNEIGATLELQGSLGGGTSQTFSNFGSLIVNNPTAGTSSIGAAFYNTGSVDVQFGTFNLNGNGLDEGGLTVESGTEFTPNNYTLDGAAITGAGTVLVNQTFDTFAVIGSSSITNVSIDNGDLNIHAGATLSVQTLSDSGPFVTLTNNGTLTVADTFTWTTNGISGTGSINLEGTSTFSAGSFSGQQVNNTGTATVSVGDSISFSSGTVWNNETGSTLTLQGSIGGSSSETLNNSGSVDASSTSGTLSVGPRFNNSGGVFVQSGTLSLNSGGTGGGTFNVEAGAVFSPSTYALKGATVSGAGILSLSGGTLTVNSSSSVQNLSVSGGTVNDLSTATLSVQDLTFSGGTLTIASTLTVQDAFTWSGGTFNGGGNTVLVGTSILSAGTVGAQVIDNFGTATISGSDSIGMSATAVWNNESGAALNLQGSLGGGTSQTFNNSGSLIVDNPSGVTSSIGAAFYNTGSVDVQFGILDLNGGGLDQGTFTVESGTEFTPNTYTLEGAITGPGLVFVNQTFNAFTVIGTSSITNVSIDNGDLQISAGATLGVQTLSDTGPFVTLANNGTLTITSTLNWTTNSISGTGSLNLEGTSTLSAGSISGQQVDNTGTATITIPAGNSFNFSGGTVWNNDSGSTLDLQGSIGGNSPSVLNNAGLILVQAGTGTITVSVPVNNSGTIDIESGILSVSGGYTNTGSITASSNSGIEPDHTITTVNSNFPISGVGQTVTLTATVAAVDPGLGAITGSVKFYDNGTTVLGSAQLPDSGLSQVTITATLSSAGTHNITAVYNGTSNYATSTSAAVNEAIFGTGVNVSGGTIYIVGQTNSSSIDSVVIAPVGKSLTGSTGVRVTSTIDGAAHSTIYAQPYTAIYVFDGNGNNTVSMSSTLTLNTYIFEGNGNDHITTGGGIAVITVGSGKDSIVTGTGNKTITANSGSDTVTAGTGTDVISLGGGNDTVKLGNGNNTVTLGDGKDYVSAGSGNNTVTLGIGTGDAVHLGNGNNVVTTGNGSADVITAGTGDNLIVAGTGQHTVTLGKGQNILIDGSVTLTQTGETLGQVLAQWIANGDSTSNLTTIRSELDVTYNTINVNHLTTGTGLDWFWFTYPLDVTTMTKTDVHN